MTRGRFCGDMGVPLCLSSPPQTHAPADHNPSSSGASPEREQMSTWLACRPALPRCAKMASLTHSLASSVRKRPKLTRSACCRSARAWQLRCTCPIMTVPRGATHELKSATKRANSSGSCRQATCVPYSTSEAITSPNCSSGAGEGSPTAQPYASTSNVLVEGVEAELQVVKEVELLVELELQIEAELTGQLLESLGNEIARGGGMPSSLILETCRS